MHESDTAAVVHGGLATSKSLEELLAILSPAFPQGEIRESSHYEGGHYVKIKSDAGSHIGFERCSDLEYLISGDGEDPREFLGFVDELAEVLVAADIIHRLEVYQGEELLSGTTHRWEEANTVEQAPMIVASRYSRIEDAQKDAARLAKRGIRTKIVHGGGGAPIAGTGPTLELHVDARDMEKMEGMQAEIEDEIASERPYECPKCGSKNYAPWQSKGAGILGALSVLMRRRPRQMDDYLNYRCGDCGCYFRVKVV